MCGQMYSKLSRASQGLLEHVPREKVCPEASFKDVAEALVARDVRSVQALVDATDEHLDSGSPADQRLQT
jgi:hypothetical protein